jgi:hypothetical protein
MLYSSINDAIRKQPMIIDSSRYWEVFDAYRKRFDESRIKIVWFEEYIANTTNVFQDVCRFLGIDDTWIPDLACERTNSRNFAEMRLAKLGRENVSINTSWEVSCKKWVINQIREDNINFLQYFGRPLDYWGDLL